MGKMGFGVCFVNFFIFCDYILFFFNIMMNSEESSFVNFDKMNNLCVGFIFFNVFIII